MHHSWQNFSSLVSGLKHIIMEKHKSNTGQSVNLPQIRPAETESDHSDGTNDSNNNTPTLDKARPIVPKRNLRASSTRNKKYLLKNRRESEWEIIEGLKVGQTFDKIPVPYSGFLHKKRKWPLKGWHKRYFVLENGILTYAKSAQDISRGKIHGTIDIGLSVISTKEDGCRLHIDTEEFIYHMKAKTIETFRCWADKLKDHRLYRHHLLLYGREPVSGVTSNIKRNQSIVSTSFSNDFFAVSIEQAQTDLQQLEKCFNQLSGLSHESEIESLPNLYRRSNKKSGSRKRQLFPTLSTSSQKESTNDGTDVNVLRSVASDSSASLSSQVIDPNLDLRRSPVFDIAQKKDDFLVISKKMLELMRKLMDTFLNERKCMNTVNEMDQNNTSNLDMIITLRTNLEKALKTNGELRSKLDQIHQLADTQESNIDLLPLENYESSYSEGSKSSEANTSIFYDAESGSNTMRLSPVAATENSADYTIVPSTANNSESSSIDSLSSEDVECSLSSNDNQSLRGAQGSRQPPTQLRLPTTMMGRRTTLPVPKYDREGLSLWNLLCKNIGKDLTQISMPVHLNEPLNTLQKLCEELEYSELIDKAAECTDPIEQMVYVASFAVSAYANSQYRAASKPFNPLLGETYECVREDKGFSFVAEQVLHHPPVSTCHAKSNNFEFWQDIRVKSKFWGKSMEIQPVGFVNLYLPRTKTYYKWNKVTTCIHNLFNNKRWVDQYGELTITNTSGNVTCNLTFVKASYWSSKKNEFYGKIVTEDGKVAGNLFGRWSDVVYFGDTARCVWKPNAMPDNYEKYYGFSQFAIELNELTDDLCDVLPITDTRFRPDQRALEEGRIDEADKLKTQLELRQREKRKINERMQHEVKPRWFVKEINSDGEEFWRFTGEYWEHRKNKTFPNLELEPLW